MQWMESRRHEISLHIHSEQLVPGAVGWAPLDAAVNGVAMSSAQEPRALHGDCVSHQAAGDVA